MSLESPVALDTTAAPLVSACGVVMQITLLAVCVSLTLTLHCGLQATSSQVDEFNQLSSEEAKTLYLGLQPKLYTWGYSQDSVPGYTTKTLYLGLQPRLCTWGYSQDSVPAVTAETLYLGLQPKLCTWGYS
ncbi:unnamed protein product [Timema podura]|uniref:Uncharacterized protein n=1 Tax=Timema podura TaxID=61482 RepID=A0ABN7NTV5_TIMPD|nr:unnamed protein product [Timema podura]